MEAKNNSLTKWLTHFDQITNEPEKALVWFQKKLSSTTNGHTYLTDAQKFIDSNFTDSTRYKIITVFIAANLVCFFGKQLEENSSQENSMELANDYQHTFFVYFEKMQKLARELLSKDDPLLPDDKKINLCFLLGKTCSSIKYYFEAKKYYKNAVSFSEINAIQQIKCLIRLSNCYYRHGVKCDTHDESLAPELVEKLYLKAVENLDKALSLPVPYKKNQIYLDLLQAHYRLSLLYAKTHRPTQMIITTIFTAINSSVCGLTTDMNTFDQKLLFLQYLNSCFKNLHTLLAYPQKLNNFQAIKNQVIQFIPNLTKLLFSLNMAPNVASLRELSDTIALFNSQDFIEKTERSVHQVSFAK